MTGCRTPPMVLYILTGANIGECLQRQKFEFDFFAPNFADYGRKSDLCDILHCRFPEVVRNKKSY